jgi:hypothetical protein
MKKTNNKPIVDETNCTPNWMVTMGDTMSLLVCFFVLLLTFSDLNSEKLTNMFGMFSGSSGVIGRKSRMSSLRVRGQDAEEKALSPVLLRFSDIPDRLHATRRRLAVQGFKEYVTLQQLKYGLRIRIDECVLFDDEQSVSTQGIAILEEVGNLINGVDNEVRLVTVAKNNTSRAELPCWKTAAVADCLATDSGLKRDRFGFGIRFSAETDTDNTFEINLMENAGVAQVRFSDLWQHEEW